MRGRVVVMGVSGSGKTTLGRNLAAGTASPFLDADDLHTPEAIAKMAAGIPLTDEDRWPWLGRVADWIADRRRAGEPGVVACSALKRPYRDRLRDADPELRFVYLQAGLADITARLASRTGHFFPPALVTAQFDDLEEPGPDEDVTIVPFGLTPQAGVNAALAALTP